MASLIQSLENLDQNLLKIVNGMNSPFWDDAMWWISYKYVWIPLYLIIIFLFYKKYGLKLGGLALLFGIIGIAITDLTVTHAIKNVVMRYRPTHNIDFQHLVHTVKDFNGNPYRGGEFGFVSGHAANSFFIALFCGKVLSKKYKWVLAVLVIWALIISYSRIYMGVHYPADVVCGALLGGIFGYLMSLLFMRVIVKKFSSK